MVNSDLLKDDLMLACIFLLIMVRASVICCSERLKRRKDIEKEWIPALVVAIYTVLLFPF